MLQRIHGICTSRDVALLELNRSLMYFIISGSMFQKKLNWLKYWLLIKNSQLLSNYHNDIQFLYFHFHHVSQELDKNVDFLSKAKFSAGLFFSGHTFAYCKICFSYDLPYVGLKKYKSLAILKRAWHILKVLLGPCSFSLQVGIPRKVQNVPVEITIL